MLRYVLAAAAAVLVAVPASAQNLIDNGGFETAPVPATGGYLTFPPGAPTDWVATPTVNLVDGFFQSSTNLAYEGTVFLDLIGEGTTGSISQSFDTIAGQLYNFSFAYSHNSYSGTPSASASYDISNSNLVAGSVFHTGGSNSNLNWVNFSTSFVAAGASSTLTFTNLTGDTNAGVLLDAISISAVPEPEVWAMMLLGFGAIGFQMRRRNGLRTVTA